MEWNGMECANGRGMECANGSGMYYFIYLIFIRIKYS
jgi:hypothetical protein